MSSTSGPCGDRIARHGASAMTEGWPIGTALLPWPVLCRALNLPSPKPLAELDSKPIREIAFRREMVQRPEAEADEHRQLGEKPRRHESGRKWGEIGAMVEKTLVLVRPEPERRQIRPEVSIPPVLPWLRGQRIPLQQWLLNLKLNAMAAKEAGTRSWPLQLN